jgi:hypothetical protein
MNPHPLVAYDIFVFLFMAGAGIMFASVSLLR